MNWKSFWRGLTTTRYTRLLEQQVEELRTERTALQDRVRLLETRLAPQLHPQAKPTQDGKSEQVSMPAFKTRVPWRQRKIELEREHNKIEERGKVVAESIASVLTK
jgi:hypothetical protein